MYKRQGTHYVVIDAKQVPSHSALVNWLADETTEKVVYDAKKTYALAARLDIEINGITFDAMLASYLIDPSHTIEDVHSVMTEYQQNYVRSDVQIYGKGKKRQIPEDDTLNYHVATILESVDQSQPRMLEILESHNQRALLTDLELPLARILSKMEVRGIYTDVTDLQDMETEIPVSYTHLTLPTSDLV